MQPDKLIRYAAIILLLFYFSTSYGFLDTCPKRNSVTDKCYGQDDKHRDHQRSERRVADVPQREVRLWRKEDRHPPSTNDENRRVLDRNNNHETFQRERRDVTRERSLDQLALKNDRGTTRFRSFNTDRVNTDRRNAGNSMQKPIFDNVRRNLEVARSVDVDKTAQSQKQRLSRIHEAENRRSTQPNSNEVRQREATKKRDSASVFRREQLGLREAEARVRNSERTNTRQDKNGNVRDRDISRVLTDRKSIENDSRRSSVRAFDDRRRAFVRSTEDSSRSGDEGQISSARDGRQRDSDARRDVASSRSRRETGASSSRREERSSYTRDNQPSSIRRALPLPDSRRNVIHSRSTRQQHDGFRRELLASDTRQDTIPSRFRQEQRESRQPSIRRLTPTDVHRDSSYVFRHEARTRDDRLSSIRRVSLASKQEERVQRETSSSSDVRRDAVSAMSRREERISSARIGPQFSIHRERALSNVRRDAETSRFRQEEQSTFTRDTRRPLSPSGVRRDQTIKREERISSTRDGRQSLIRRETTRHDAVFSTFRKEGRTSFAMGDDRRDTSASSFRREIARRGLPLSNTRRDITPSRFRQEKESSRTTIQRELTINEDTRNTRLSRSASSTSENSIRREFGEYYERSSRTISKTSRVRGEVDGNEGRIRLDRNLPASRTSEQRRQLLKVDDIRENERRQSPSDSIFLSNDRRRTMSPPSRLHVKSRQLLNQETYSRTSFSERSKSEIRDNFGYEQVQLQDWSNLAKTLLIALTLFQILAKTYPKKAGFQNLLHNSLSCVKQKVQ